MSDSFSVVSSESWFSRLFGSIKSVLFGLVVFAASFVVLWWNEGRAVRTARSLTEGLGAVVSVPADSVNAANDGKLVHVSGAVKTTAPVADDELPVRSDGIKLIRNVEMYQWTEKESTESRKKLGGGTEKVTTYSYQKEWKSGRVDSAQFKKADGHENPPAPPFESKTFTADPVKIGAFTMSPQQLSQLNNGVDVPVDSAAAANLPEALKGKVQVKDGRFYMGQEPASPQLGDVRISYRAVRPAAVSLVAVQTASTFAPYNAKAGDTILLVEEGTKAAAEMFKVAQERNAVLSWILRAAGFFMMFLGIFLVFRPIAVFADVVPLFGTMLSAGIGLFSFLGAIGLSFLTIAIAWVVVRPVLGISLLIVAAAGLIALLRIGSGRKAARAATVPASAVVSG